jgi:predicted nucleotidyltransferase
MVEQPESDSTDIQPLLADLRAALEALYGDRLVRLVLYGSHARGDAHAESDVDVLVVLEGPVQPGREIRRMGRVRTTLGLEYERPLSLLPVSVSEYQNRSSMWLQNVHQEGMTI